MKKPFASPAVALAFIICWDSKASTSDMVACEVWWGAPQAFVKNNNVVLI
jgi:hypothetical protein